MKKLVLLLLLASPAYADQDRTTLNLGCTAANLLLAELVGGRTYRDEGARFRKYVNESALAQIVLDWSIKIESGDMTVSDLKSFHTKCYDIVAK